MVDSIRAAAVSLVRSSRVWAAVIGALAMLAVPTVKWVNTRAEQSDLEALELELGKSAGMLLRLEQQQQQQRRDQVAALRELAAAWAWERVQPARRGVPVTAEQRAAAAERARAHFIRLHVRDGYEPPEALRIALRQIEVAR